MIARSLWILAVMVLAGCNTDPSTNVRQPMTTRPSPPVQMARGDGAIYHAENGRPLFEDMRARFVGDTITVNIVENTAATKNSSESSDRKGSASVAVTTPKVLGYDSPTNLDTSFTADSKLKTENKGSGSNSNNFRGSITVTVLEVLPNGNLVVSGEKQVAINNQTEFIRLSGVVNPIYITSANSVNSTQLADARVESKGKQDIDTAQIVSMLARFFVTLMPF